MQNKVFIINGNEYLYVNKRVPRYKVYPKYAYDIKANDKGKMIRINPYVAINFAGTIIGDKPLPMGRFGTYFIKDSDTCN